MGKGSRVISFTGSAEVFNKETGRFEDLGSVSNVNLDNCKENEPTQDSGIIGDVSGSMACKINKRAYRKLMRALRKMAKEVKK